MNKKQKFQITLSLMIFVLVALITWQIKGVRKNTAVESQISNRVDVLQSELKTTLDKNQDLMEQIAVLQNDVARYRAQITEDDGVTAILKEDLLRAETVAGMTDLVGNGVVITVNDGNPSQLPEGIVADSGYGIVHDSYILSLLNELRSAGAEAISINDERILSMSEIRCAGPTISINNTKKAAPFEIKVIGDPETLENALKMPGGAVEQSSFYGIDLSIKKSNNVIVKKYTGIVSFKHAQNVTTEVTE